MGDQLNDENNRAKPIHKKVYQLKRKALTLSREFSGDNEFDSEGDTENENEGGNLALEQRSIQYTTSYDTRLKRFGDGGLLIPSQITLDTCLNERNDAKVIDPIIQLDKSSSAKLNLIKDTSVNNLQRNTTLLKPNLNFGEKENSKLLDQPVDLIPIRIELDLYGYYLNDVFMYNSNEPVVTPKYLAETIYEDLNLNESSLQLFDRNIVEEITAIIERQIDSYQNLKETEIENEHLFKEHEKNKTILVPIQLDLALGRFQLKDAFLWDIDASTTPLNFATILAADLGLGGEFVSTINHSIHEQLLQFRTARVDAVPYLKSLKSRGELKQVMQLLKSAPELNPYLEAILFTDKVDQMIHSRSATFNLSLKRMTKEKRQALTEKLSKSAEFAPRGNWSRPGTQRRVSKRTVTLRYSNLNQQSQSPYYE